MKKLFSLALSLSLVALVVLQMNSNNYNVDISESEAFNGEIPEISLNDPVEVDPHTSTVFDDQFPDQTSFDNDWGTTGDANVQIQSSKLEINATNALGLENAIVWTLGFLPMFYKGTIEYNIEVIESSWVDFYVRIYEGATPRFSQRYQSDYGPTTDSYVLPDICNYKSNLRIFFEFDGSVQNDQVTIDYIKIEAQEFYSYEADGDPVKSNQSQELKVAINPDFADNNNWDKSKVYVQYKVNDSNPDTSYVLCNNVPSTNNFTHTIPSSTYTPQDEVYYRYRIEDAPWTEDRFSDVFSFLVSDGDAPVISDPTAGNYSSAMYYNNVSIQFLINDSTNLGGSGINSVVMRCENGTIPDGSDPIVYCVNKTPYNDGYYDFIIDSKYLDADSDLYYKIWVTDVRSNTQTYTGFFIVDDDRSPQLSFVDVSPRLPDEVEYNESTYFYYDITEPIAASGLQTVQIRIKSGSDIPTDADDYDDTEVPISLFNVTGGTFIFEVGEEYYNYSNTIYAWVFAYANDSFGNEINSSAFPIRINVTDSYDPDVLQTSSNIDNCSYDVDKVLNYIITESALEGASGINSDSLCLYYQVNDISLSSPAKINKSIGKWGGSIDFTIPKSEYLLHDIIYFKINVSDNEGNLYDSGVKQFGIWDLTKPSLTFNDISDLPEGLVLYYEDVVIKYEISEPSEGIGFDSSPTIFKLYYKKGSAPSSPTDYTGILNPEESSIEREGGVYTFIIDSDNTTLNTFIYYWVNITDIYNNHKDDYSDGRWFNVSRMISKLVHYPSGYINYRNINLTLTTNHVCNIWYVINGTNSSTAVRTNRFSQIVNLTGEGEFSIVFYCHDSRTENSKSVLFVVDTIAPDQVVLTYVLVGPIIELQWEAPAGTDSDTYYMIYKSTDPEFEIGSATLLTKWDDKIDDIHELYQGELKYIDLVTASGFTYYYKIVAIDRAGNSSPVSDLLTASVPGSPIIIYVIIGAIIGAVAVVGYFVMKKMKYRNIRPVYTKEELKTIEKQTDIDFDDTILTSTQPKWDTIKTVKSEQARLAPKVPAGGPVLSKTIYWNSELTKLIQEGFNYEAQGKYSEAIKTFQILSRICGKINGGALARHFQDKILSLYNKA